MILSENLDFDLRMKMVSWSSYIRLSHDSITTLLRADSLEDMIEYHQAVADNLRTIHAQKVGRES